MHNHAFSKSLKLMVQSIHKSVSDKHKPPQGQTKSLQIDGKDKQQSFFWVRLQRFGENFEDHFGSGSIF